MEAMRSISTFSGGGFAPAPTGSLEKGLHFRVGLVEQHIQAAARFARRAGEVEKEHKGEGYAAFFDEITHHVTAAVLFSVASMETNINEAFIDASADPNLPEDKRVQVKALWKANYRNPNVLSKYAELYALLTGQEINKGVVVYQNALILIRVRNALMHFVPEWRHESVEHTALEEDVRSKHLISPFHEHEKEPVFPTGYMSHAMAMWAVRSGLAFMADFSQRTGLPEKLAGVVITT